MSGGEEFVATIQVNITVAKNVAILDVASIAAVIIWVETNIRSKLPPDCNFNVQYNITP